jgi:D-alanyl-D-alanine-carboxypeptidase/D-alanyl-D-alanine-endopeptidase
MGHKSSAQVISNRVSKPLGMSSIFTDFLASHLALLSSGYDTTLHLAKHWQMPTLAGTGAIKSTIKNTVRYLQTNLNADVDFIQLTHKQITGLDNKGEKVALAWFTNGPKNGLYRCHNRGTDGFRSLMGFDQASNKSIVILEITINGIDLLSEILRA